jgi:hypothetical protein
MSNIKFIGGGFPGIKPCIEETNNITKESREKREFSVRKIIPISQILANTKKSIDVQSKQNFNNLTEDFNIIQNNNHTFDFEPVENFLHSQFNGSVNNGLDINLINAPVNKTVSQSKTKRSKSKTKRSKSKTNRSKSKTNRSKSKN